MSTRERERALHYQKRQKFDRELQSRGAEFSKYTHIRRQAYDKLGHTAEICLESLVFEQQKEFSGIKLTPFFSKDPQVFLAAYFRTERFQHTTILAQRALRTTPFRVLPGLGETGPRPGNSTDLSLVMRLERLARATSILPSLHALERILRPTEAEPLISKYESNIFR